MNCGEPVLRNTSESSKKSKKKAKGEKELVKEYLGNFITEKSRAYRTLCQWGLDQKNQTTYVTIATVISVNHGINLPRLCKKYKGPIIKWFDDNYDIVFPAMSKMVLFFTVS